MNVESRSNPNVEQKQPNNKTNPNKNNPNVEQKQPNNKNNPNKNNPNVEQKGNNVNNSTKDSKQNRSRKDGQLQTDKRSQATSRTNSARRLSTSRQPSRMSTSSRKGNTLSPRKQSAEITTRITTDPTKSTNLAQSRHATDRETDRRDTLLTDAKINVRLRQSSFSNRIWQKSVPQAEEETSGATVPKTKSKTKTEKDTQTPSSGTPRRQSTHERVMPGVESQTGKNQHKHGSREIQQDQNIDIEHNGSITKTRKGHNGSNDESLDSSSGHIRERRISKENHAHAKHHNSNDIASKEDNRSRHRGNHDQQIADVHSKERHKRHHSHDHTNKNGQPHDKDDHNETARNYQEHRKTHHSEHNGDEHKHHDKKKSYTSRQQSLFRDKGLVSAKGSGSSLSGVSRLSTPRIENSSLSTQDRRFSNLIYSVYSLQAETQGGNTANTSEDPNTDLSDEEPLSQQTEAESGVAGETESEQPMSESEVLQKEAENSTLVEDLALPQIDPSVQENHDHPNSSKHSLNNETHNYKELQPTDAITRGEIRPTDDMFHEGQPIDDVVPENQGIDTHTTKVLPSVDRREQEELLLETQRVIEATETLLQDLESRDDMQTTSNGQQYGGSSKPAFTRQSTVDSGTNIDNEYMNYLKELLTEALTENQHQVIAGTEPNANLNMTIPERDQTDPSNEANNTMLNTIYGLIGGLKTTIHNTTPQVGNYWSNVEDKLEQSVDEHSNNIAVSHDEKSSDPMELESKLNSDRTIVDNIVPDDEVEKRIQEVVVELNPKDVLLAEEPEVKADIIPDASDAGQISKINSKTSKGTEQSTRTGSTSTVQQSISDEEQYYVSSGTNLDRYMDPIGEKWPGRMCSCTTAAGGCFPCKRYGNIAVCNVGARPAHLLSDLPDLDNENWQGVKKTLQVHEFLFDGDVSSKKFEFYDENLLKARDGYSNEERYDYSDSLSYRPPFDDAPRDYDKPGQGPKCTYRPGCGSSRPTNVAYNSYGASAHNTTAFQPFPRPFLPVSQTETCSTGACSRLNATCATGTCPIKANQPCSTCPTQNSVRNVWYCQYDRDDYQKQHVTSDGPSSRQYSPQTTQQTYYHTEQPRQYADRRVYDNCGISHLGSFSLDGKFIGGQPAQGSVFSPGVPAQRFTMNLPYSERNAHDINTSADYRQNYVVSGNSPSSSASSSCSESPLYISRQSSDSRIDVAAENNNTPTERKKENETLRQIREQMQKDTAVKLGQGNSTQIPDVTVASCSTPPASQQSRVLRSSELKGALINSYRRGAPLEEEDLNDLSEIDLPPLR